MRIPIIILVISQGRFLDLGEGVNFEAKCCFSPCHVVAVCRQVYSFSLEARAATFFNPLNPWVPLRWLLPRLLSDVCAKM